MTVSGRYRINSRSDAGGSYTLSRLWGNFDGENTASGPLTTDLFQYPEYREAAWFAPEGDLAADQRHRATFWFNYGVPKIEGLTISVLQDLATGVPYGAGGGLASGQSGFSASAVVDARPYVPDLGYATPQGGTRETYYYTARDAFRTEMSRRTDMALNYSYRVPRSRSAEAFIQAQMLNIFNVQDLCACGADVFNNGGGVALSRIGSGVLTPVSTPSLAPFNPFTTTPVQGVNWNYNTQLRHAAEPVRVHVAADVPDDVRTPLLMPSGLAPRTPIHARSRAASPARSARVARSLCSLAALDRVHQVTHSCSAVARSRQLPIHHVPVLDLERRPGVHLEAQHAFGNGVLAVLVDRDAHQLAVEELQDHRSARDDVIPIPAVDVHHAAQERRVADLAEHLVLRPVDDARRLAAGGEDDVSFAARRPAALVVDVADETFREVRDRPDSP